MSCSYPPNRIPNNSDDRDLSVVLGRDEQYKIILGLPLVTCVFLWMFVTGFWSAIFVSAAEATLAFVYLRSRPGGVTSFLPAQPATFPSASFPGAPAKVVQAAVTPASPCVVWFTGLPSSGKTTLSLLLKEALLAKGHDVEHLDGDAVRAIVPGIGFTRADRNDHIRRMGFLTSRLEAHHVTVVASFVSPYRESRDFVRGLCGRFLEVYLSTDLEECSRRDVKGLYQETREGTRSGMTGVDDPYEPPVSPELILNTANLSKEECVRQILRLIESAKENSSETSSAALSVVDTLSSEQSNGSSVAA